jgi:hypothetical protein
MIQSKHIFNFAKAYRNYGLKVNALQKKLEELIDKLPLTNDTKLETSDMEMSDEERDANHSHKRHRSHSHDRNGSRSPSKYFDVSFLI